MKFCHLFVLGALLYVVLGLESIDTENNEFAEFEEFDEGDKLLWFLIAYIFVVSKWFWCYFCSPEVKDDWEGDDKVEVKVLMSPEAVTIAEDLSEQMDEDEDASVEVPTIFQTIWIICFLWDLARFSDWFY